MKAPETIRYDGTEPVCHSTSSSFLPSFPLFRHSLLQLPQPPCKHLQIAHPQPRFLPKDLRRQFHNALDPAQRRVELLICAFPDLTPAAASASVTREEVG
jgi:hypothetical protein